MKQERDLYKEQRGEEKIEGEERLRREGARRDFKRSEEERK